MLMLTDMMPFCCSDEAEHKFGKQQAQWGRERLARAQLMSEVRLAAMFASSMCVFARVLRLTSLSP